MASRQVTKGAGKRLPIEAQGPGSTTPKHGGLGELCSEEDQFHDYILSPYRPLRPHVGKLRSVNLLYESFAAAGVQQEGAMLVDGIRTTLGPFRTVWGLKLDAAERRILGWELYFYDFDRLNADLSLRTLRDCLDGILTVDAEEPWDLPWHMFSIELDVDALVHSTPVAAHVYMDMRSYELRGRDLTFENIYTFHDPASEIRDVLRRIQSCPHLPHGKYNLGELMPPYLFRCAKLCVAHKRKSDALYFSRIPTRSFRRFLDRYTWPSGLTGFVHDNAAHLDHLLWDVGVDVRLIDDRPRIAKIGIYGSF